jgi:hypothetical protein
MSLSFLRFTCPVVGSHLVTVGSPKNHSGYNASASLRSLIKTNVFSLHYARDASDSSGLGSVSETQQAGLGVSRPFGKKASVDRHLGLRESRNTLKYLSGARYFRSRQHWDSPHTKTFLQLGRPIPASRSKFPLRIYRTAAVRLVKVPRS